jgi:hypothetical protein
MGGGLQGGVAGISESATLGGRSRVSRPETVVELLFEGTLTFSLLKAVGGVIIGVIFNPQVPGCRWLKIVPFLVIRVW